MKKYYLIKTTSNRRKDVTPKDGKRMSLKKLQQLVGGFVESFKMSDNLKLYFDENGHLKNLKPNSVHTSIVGNVVECYNKESI